RRTVAAIVWAETPAAARAEDIRHVENRSVVAPDREVVGVAVRERARVVDHLRAHHAADDPHPLTCGDGEPWREAGRRREISGVHRRDQQAAAAHEFLQMFDAAEAET